MSTKKHKLSPATRTLIAVDPGEVNNGCIMMSPRDGKIYRSFTRTVSNLLFASEVEDILNDDPQMIMCVEEFVLYPGKAKFKGHSKFETVEVIGMLRYIAVKHNIPFYMVKTSHAVAFFKGKDTPSQLATAHEVSAWKVGEWFRKFQIEVTDGLS